MTQAWPIRFSLCDRYLRFGLLGLKITVRCVRWKDVISFASEWGQVMFWTEITKSKYIMTIKMLFLAKKQNKTKRDRFEP